MVACQRLEAISTPGAYLIRESSSERGAFVLSFLDSTGRVHHFRIVRSHQNQFNIGGTTWFSSLAKLVAYHTKYSSVMENVNERLDVPVPPPSVSYLCIKAPKNYNVPFSPTLPVPSNVIILYFNLLYFVLL